MRIFWLFLFPLSLFSLEVSADFSDLENHLLKLKGHVKLTTANEMVSSDYATVVYDELNKEMKASILVDGNVTVEIKEENQDLFLFFDRAYLEKEGEVIQIRTAPSTEVRFLIKKSGKTMSYGLADELYYDSKTQTASLNSHDQRVLFWTEEGTIVSAEGLKISKNHEIQAVGKTHLTLSNEETKRFESFVKEFVK